MKSAAFAFALTLACLMAAAPTARADVIIDPANVTTTMGSLGSGGYADIGNVFNQSGLSSSYTSGVTDFASYTSTATATGGDTNIWTSNAVATGNVDVSLGATYTINAFALWTPTSTNATLSVDQFTLIASNSSTFSTYTTLGTFDATEPTTTAAQAAQVFHFANTSAAYVRIEIQSNYGNTSYTSINEIAFGAVPAPSSLIQCGLAGLIAPGIWLSRRFWAARPAGRFAPRLV